MKKLNNKKISEFEELNEFQNHIAFVMEDIRTYREYLPRKKKYMKCYNTLLEMWEVIQERIEYLCENNTKYSILDK